MSSLIPVYEYDIFISYRQKDNKYDGWVTEFVDNLKKELEATFKEEITVYFDISPHDGLLETHDVYASLKEKLKCIVFIPIISRTYCDPKSFAWEHEFKGFIEQASRDQFGIKIKLSGGNVANRVLPVRINDLDIKDITLFESSLGGVLRSIDFVYKETGVNRQLRSKDDDIIKSPGQVLYRDQINKVALAVKDIIESMKIAEAQRQVAENEFQPMVSPAEKDLLNENTVQYEESKPKRDEKPEELSPSRVGRFQVLLRKPKVFVPGILLILIVIAVTSILIHNHFRVRWANKEALPAIDEFVNNWDFPSAFNLFMRAQKYISDESKVKELESLITSKLTILTDPPGADVYIREYSDINGGWEKIGRTPINNLNMPNFSFYLTRVEKQGYEDVLAVTATSDTLYRKLFVDGTIPPGMVYVDDYDDGLTYVLSNEKNGFYIDRYEVTNKQFKEFVDRGGYGNPKYWNNEFIKDGKRIVRDEAIAEFTDLTGRPGPSTWKAGNYPDGQDDYPVTGVSWYEAAAYAEYAGKSLPTANHWSSGAGLSLSNFTSFFGSKLYSISNFNGNSTTPAGKSMGVTCYGAYDLAGNVREWCFNETKDGRIIRGGSWDDANYTYNIISQLPSFDRSYRNGFRCVQYINREKIPESAFRRFELTGKRDFSKEEPLSEEVFRIYMKQFLYDKTDLEATIENRDESPDGFVTEKITFNAAYGDERMIAYLYLPKNVSPPFQTLIFFPGQYAIEERDLKNSIGSMYFSDYIIKSGRAVLYPIYKGTFERNDGLTVAKYNNRYSHEYTEWVVRWVKDFSRSVDYLETRDDVDIDNIGFLGHSWGGVMGGIISAAEERLKVSVLVLGGGLQRKAYPEAEVINYVSRIKIPVLMLNGKYDMIFPLESAVKPFYNLIRTPEKDKHLYVSDTDHYIPKNEMIREVNNWLDRYMGPVK